MRGTLVTSVAMMLALVCSAPAHARLLRGRFEIAVRAIVNPVEGAPRVLCQTETQSDLHNKVYWWIGLAAADERETVACGAGDDQPTESDRFSVLTRFTTSVRPITEGPLVLEVAMQQSEEKREFQLWPHHAQAFVPVMVARDDQQESLGGREMILELEVKVVGEEVDGSHGSLRVRSELADAVLRLDGGVVGTVTRGEETLLPHVRVGLRELQARDADGLLSRRIVRVLPGYSVAVDLGPPPAAHDLLPAGKNAQGHEEYRRARDGALMVKVPAGEFVMGNSKTERQPLEHKVHLSEFLIDKTGVTWGQYKRYSSDTGTPLPAEPYWGIHDDHPVVFVTWDEGRAYCEWAGGRLPTEAEREKAARGADGRLFPWGEAEPDPELAVFRRSWGFEATDPVGSHPAGISPYGVLDAGGNVWEWCNDWYDKDYYRISPYRDPQGPRTGHAHVVRGGSWDSRPTVLSCSCRSFGNTGYSEGDFGFRCAMDSPP